RRKSEQPPQHPQLCWSVLRQRYRATKKLFPAPRRDVLTCRAAGFLQPCHPERSMIGQRPIMRSRRIPCTVAALGVRRRVSTNHFQASKCKKDASRRRHVVINSPSLSMAKPALSAAGGCLRGGCCSLTPQNTWPPDDVPPAPMYSAPAPAKNPKSAELQRFLPGEAAQTTSSDPPDSGTPDTQTNTYIQQVLRLIKVDGGAKPDPFFA